jgi:hypothetical protein
MGAFGWQIGVALVVWGLTTPSEVRGQAATGIPSCDTDSTYHQLDFWVGEWRVTADGVLDGTDRIEKVLNGCAVSETWHDVAPGHEGRSLFFVASAPKRWKQVWVTETARALGGTKEKGMIASYPGGGVRFQGELIGPLGRVLLDRTTLTPMPNGTVQQVIERSIDGGSTWTTPYTATYTRIAR